MDQGLAGLLGAPTSVQAHKAHAMHTTQLPDHDELADFDRQTCAFEGITKQVYVAGQGPAVIVMPEMPGISPQVARFARWVRDAGLTVYLPSLFGRDGATQDVPEAIEVFKRTCISAEFQALGAGRATPIVTWLRALARLAHAQCGGPGVGAVGMCFTGNFALSLVLDAPTLAPVVCQPSLPLDSPASTGMSDAELAAIGSRLNEQDLNVLALRFEGDKWCTAQRFAAFRQALGERFDEKVLPDACANPAPPPFFRHVVACAHSVVTAHLVDQQGHPTMRAKDQIIAFLRQRLLMLKPDSASPSVGP